MTAPVELVVETTAGPVRGRREAGMTAWRGIPFAAPPVGALRFRAPRAPEPWTTVLDATSPGDVPVQLRTSAMSGAGPRTPMSEDCLTLNVLRRTGGGAGKPVMVFIYGGAYGIGSSIATQYTGEHLAARGDVVFVGFNYRLGPLGWMDLSRWSTPERPIETNLGLRDQLAALRWVHDNIAAFGGDPDNVTLFGESAGGTSVATLLTVPAARGLIAKAIVESATLATVYGPERMRGWADRYAGMLGVPEGEVGRHLLEAPADELVRAAFRLDAELAEDEPGARVFAPEIDGDLLPEAPLEAFRHGRSHPVPMIIGTNRNEGTLFQLLVKPIAATPARIDRLFALTAPDAQSVLLEGYPGYPHGRVLADLVTDVMFWIPSVRAAEGHARVAPTWMYRFDFLTPFLVVSRLLSTHGVELDFVFGRTDTVLRRLGISLGGGRAARALTARLHRRWIAFARNGTVDWPPYDPAARRTMLFDTADRVVRDPRRATREAFEPYRDRGYR